MKSGTEHRHVSPAENLFFGLYVCIFAMGVAILMFEPTEWEKIRTLSAYLVYITDLPLFLTAILIYSTRRGWLIIGKEAIEKKKTST